MTPRRHPRRARIAAGLSGTNQEIVWRDGSGRDWKPHELEKSHLANVIYHMTEYSGKYSRTLFEAMITEAVKRGLTDEYLAAAPYPFIDATTGVKMIADYSSGIIKFNNVPYDGEGGIDHFVLQIGASVIGITLDSTVFGDPVLSNDLPTTTREAKYDANDIILWNHDIGAAIMTYWMQQLPDGVIGDITLMETRKKKYVLLKVSQKNRYDITHLIVKGNDLVLCDPESA